MGETGSTPDTEGRSSQQACSSSGIKFGGMCFSWKVIGGLVAVGVGVWIVAPNLVVGVVPLLAIAACPLSMMFMMRGMSGGQHDGGYPIESQDKRTRDLATLKAEHARLTAELEALESVTPRSTSGRPALHEGPNGSRP